MPISQMSYKLNCHYAGVVSLMVPNFIAHITCLCSGLTVSL